MSDNWDQVFACFEALWPKRLDAQERDTYRTVLGAHDPAVITQVLSNLAASGTAAYYPTPAQLAFHVASATPRQPERSFTEQCDAWCAEHVPDLDRDEAMYAVGRLAFLRGWDFVSVEAVRREAMEVNP